MTLYVHTNTHDDEANNARQRTDVSGSWREEYAAQGVDPSGHELVTDGGRDRPDGCICWDDSNDLPCFPCRRDGFTDPNPTEPESDTDVEAYPATIGEADSSENEPDQAVATDGGSASTSTFTVPEPGDVVRDCETTHGDDRLLVLGVNEETSAGSEYIKEIGKTVAEVNPEYSPRAPIARCVYYEEVEDVDPQAALDDVRSAVELNIFSSYTFPVDRLSAGDVDVAGGDGR